MQGNKNKPSSNVLQPENRPDVLVPAITLPSRAAQLGIYGSIASPTVSDRALCNRFALQSHARRIIADFAIDDCNRKIIPMKKDLDGVAHENRPQVDVYISGTSGKPFYGNLVQCKSVWVCPVCASKITERRKREMRDALDVSLSAGHYHLLATFTVSHKISESIDEIADGIRNGFRRLKVGKSWKLFKQRFNWFGDISSKELTFGENGWHYHIHQLVILETKPDPHTFTELQSDLKQRWRSALRKENKYASWEHGVDVRSTDDAIAEYLGKSGNWDIEHEMTKAPTKRGKLRGRTPLEILSNYALTGDIADRVLFREYADYTYRKNQLTWSRGLRDALSMEKELTDEEIVEQIEDDAVLLARLELDDWKAINRLQLHAHALVFARQAYEQTDLSILTNWVDDVREKYMASMRMNAKKNY